MSKRKLVSTIALPLIGGSIAGYLSTKSARKKYERLDTPRFSPPGWVFPVVWTSLYTMMGTAKYQFDQVPKSPILQKRGSLAYQTQLSLNYLWSFLFFKWNVRGAAFVEASLLWSAVIVSTSYFYQQSKLAGSLMVPYILWVSFALVLNYKMWQMN